jgi:hypothetical protein
MVVLGVDVNVGIITRNLNLVVTLSKRRRSKEQNDSEKGDPSDDFPANLLFDSLLYSFLRAEVLRTQRSSGWRGSASESSHFRL